MPIRYMVERGEWAKASAVIEPSVAPPEVKAIALWAQGLGTARGNQHGEVAKQVSMTCSVQEF